MKGRQEDTPPSSINGDDIMGMEGDNDDELIYLGELDEIQFDDEEMVDDQEEENDYTGVDRPGDQSELVFKKHTGSVFCCDLHVDGKIAVTGGEDDKAYVWSVETGDIIMDCTGHKDSVIFVGFSFDGAFLATVDMSGLIKVWKCDLEYQSGPWSIAFEYEADDLSWGLWHFGARVLICGANAGDIYVFKIPSGDTKVLQGHNIRTDCGKIFPDGVRLAAAYEDGAVKIWDLKTNIVLHQLPNGMHESRVTAIDIHPDNNLMASISTDGKVVLATTNNGKVVGQLQVEIDLEDVAFCPDAHFGYFALGTLNGSVTIWDTARQMVRHSCVKFEDISAGVTKMLWVKNHLVTGCLDGSLRIYDGSSGERIAMLTGHWSEILDLVYNAKKNIILSVSDDGTAKIFKYSVESENN